MVDVDGLFHQVAPALKLAEVGAHTPDGERHGEALPNQPEGLQVLPLADQSEVALDVDPGGAGELARRHAVAVVLLKQEPDEKPSGLLDLPGVGGDHHAVTEDGATGGEKFRLPLHLDDAEAAALEGPEDFAVTEGRNMDTVLPCDLENGCSRIGLKLSPVHGEVDSVLHG